MVKRVIMPEDYLALPENIYFPCALSNDGNTAKRAVTSFSRALSLCSKFLLSVRCFNMPSILGGGKKRLQF